MSMRFGFDRRPVLARAYVALVMLLIPVLFPVLFAIAYAPRAAKTFWSDLSRNYRDAWDVLTGRYHRRQQGKR
jgi:hypothetical protein